MPNVGNIKTLPDVEGEPNDAPKKLTNFDIEDFEFGWNNVKYVLPAGETGTYPKYLVNFAAMHLARKIVKREARAAQKDDEHVRQAMYSIRDDLKEKELREKAVAANFPEKQEEVKEQQEAPKEKSPLKCETCGFEAKSAFGLRAHIRLRHK